MFQKILLRSAVALSLGAGAFLLGPKPEYPPFDAVLPTLKTDITDIDSFIAAKEAKIANLKPQNESRIVWADSTKKEPTEYCMLYLHGFSASPLAEGDPVHLDLAKRYGCNLYLPRLAGHGILDSNSFRNITPKDLIDDAKEAFVLAKMLGKKVIIVGTSTGCTLGIYLAAMHPEAVAALVNYSPNITLYSNTSHLLNGHWGKQIGSLAMGGDYRTWDAPDTVRKYWTTTYRIEGLQALRSLLDETMTATTFQKVKQPIYVGYWYKDAENSDHVVSTDAMKMFFEQVSTPTDKKVIHAFPNAGNHVIASRHRSGAIAEIEQTTFDFLEKTLGLQKRTN